MSGSGRPLDDGAHSARWRASGATGSGPAAPGWQGSGGADSGAIGGGNASRRDAGAREPGAIIEQPPNGGRLPAAQAAAIRRTLDAGRSDTLDQIESLRRDFDGIVASAALVGADDEHDPEGTTIAFERAQLAALLDQARSRLAELDQALARLAEGSYGICERCGQPVAPARLAARPAARTCIACASKG